VPGGGLSPPPIRNSPSTTGEGSGAPSRAWALALLLLSFTWTRTAAATRAALYVEGRRAASVTRDVALALGPRAHAVPSRSLEAAVRASAEGDSLSHALSTREGARKIAGAARTSLGHSGADVAIAIAIAEPTSGGAERVRILLVPRSSGASALLQDADLPELETVKERMTWWAKTFRSPERPPARLDDADDSSVAIPLVAAKTAEPAATSEDVDLSSPYAEAAARAAATKAAAPSGAESSAARAPTHAGAAPGQDAVRRPPRYFVRAAFELSLRHFEDVEMGAGAARTYEAFPVPGIVASVEAYPLFGGAFGFDAAFARSFGVRSTTSERLTVETSWTRAEAALKGRFVFGKTEQAPWLALLAGYGYSSFSFESAPEEREVPTATYHMMRFGLDTSIPLHRFVFSGAAEYDHLFSIGALAIARTKAPGHGFTARLGIGFRITPWLVSRLGGRFAWFTYDFIRSVDAHAVDEYIGGEAGFEATF
jgi:hypothetical protein